MKKNFFISMRCFLSMIIIICFAIAGNSQTKNNADTAKTAEALNTKGTNDGPVKAEPKKSILKKKKECDSCPETGTIIYDFKCKRFFQLKKNVYEEINNLNKIKLKYNEAVHFKVVNINRYVYDVQFSADNVLYGSDVPPLFKELFLGDGDIMTSVLGKLKDAIGKTFAENELKDFFDKLKEFRKQYDRLIDAQLKAYMICDTCVCCDDKDRIKLTFSEVNTKLTELRRSFIKVTESLAAKKVEITKDVTDLSKELEDCKKSAELIKAKTETLNNPKLTEPEKKKITDEIEKLKKCNATTIETNLAQLKAQLELVSGTKENLETAWASLLKINDEQLMRLVLFANNLLCDHYNYVSPPVYPQGSSLELSLSISPRDTNSLVTKWGIMPLANDEIKFELPVRRGALVSFSSGPFFTFGKNFKTDEYGFKPQPDNGLISDTSEYRLEKIGNFQPPIGFSAMANISFSATPGFSFGGSVGAGATIERQPRPVYLAGLLFSFGQKQRLNLNMGIAGAHVNTLKNGKYNFNALYKTDPGDIEYNKEFKVGGFISLSYTVFTFSKNTTVSSKKNSK